MKTLNIQLGFISILCLVSTLTKAETIYLHDAQISAENIVRAFTPGKTRSIILNSPQPQQRPRVQPIPQQYTSRVANKTIAQQAVNCDAMKNVAINIKFSKNSSKLLSNERRKMVEIAKALNNPRIKNCNIVVAGHTDQSGNVLYNERLSTKRAKSVAKKLRKYGIQRNRIVPIGYGPHSLHDKQNPYNPINRRVEFELRS